jgi:hypothetical protein
VTKEDCLSCHLEPYWGVLSFAVGLKRLTYWSSPFFPPQTADQHVTQQTYLEQGGPNVKELPVYGINFIRFHSGGGRRTGLWVESR